MVCYRHTHFEKKCVKIFFMDKKTKSTTELLQILKETDSKTGLEEYVQGIDEPDTQVKSFSEFLESLPEFHQRKPSEIIRDSNIERTYGYQIFNGRKLPGRDKVIMISLALHLNLDITQKSLAAAKAPALYPRDRRDAIIIYAIEQGMTVDDTCDLLDEFGEKILD